MWKKFILSLVSTIVLLTCFINSCNCAIIQDSPLILDGNFDNSNGPPIKLGFNPMATILHPKNNEFVTDFLLDLKLHFDLKHPFVNRVTDVCIGMRMLRGKNGKSEDISTCENNIQHFRSQANGIKAKLEQMEIELPFRGYYIIELAMFHNNEILHNVIHNFSYGIAGNCENTLQKRENFIMTKVEHNNYGNDPRNILQVHPLCYDWYGNNLNNLENLDVLSSASTFRGSFGVDYTSQLQGNGDIAMLNFVLARHPRILNIVELGTFAGITSLHLGISMSLRNNGHFDTFDVQDHRPFNVKKIFTNMQDTMQFQIADFINLQPLQVTDKVSNADLVFIDSSSNDRDGKKLAIAYGKIMKVGSIIIVSHCPGESHNLNEWMNDMAKIAFTYKYHDVIANKNVVSSFGIFEKYNSEDEAKVKLCENPFLNCQKVQQPGQQQQQQQGPKVTSQPMVRV